MTKLNYLHICDMAFITADSGNLNVIGVFENISAQKFPAIHPRFSVALEIEAEEGLHTISLTMKKGDKEISKIEKTFSGRKHRWIHNFVGFKFDEAGEYVIEVSVDKVMLGLKTVNLISI